MDLNMAPNKIMIYCILVILLVSGVSALEEIDYSDTSIYDSESLNFNQDIYVDVNSYNSPDFYANSNPALWDYNLITDWNLVPADAYQNFNWNLFPANQIINIPAENLNYDWLETDEQRMQMTSAQIRTNFDRIEDLTSDVNVERAIDAVNHEYNVDVTSLGNGAQIRLNVLSATYGNQGRVSFVDVLAEEFNPYEHGTLEIDAEGNIIFFPPEINPEGFIIEEFKVNPNDIVVVDTGERKLFYQSNSVQGQLTFDQGLIYLLPGTSLDEYTSVEINGVDLRNLDLEDTLYIYLEEQTPNFNPEDHREESYVFMNQEEREMIVHTNPDHWMYNAFRFRQGNRFLEVEEEDGFNLFVHGGTQINLEQRDDQLIPLMTATVQEAKLAFGMINGGNIYVIDSNGFSSDDHFPDQSQGQVPFTLLIQNQDGENIIGPEGEKDKIIFGNDGGVAIVPESRFQEELECRVCSNNIRNSEVLLTYNSDDLAALEALPITNNLDELDVDLRNRLLFSIRNLPPEMIASASEIIIVPDNELANYCHSPTVAGCTTRDTRIIYLPESIVGPTLVHEYAHTYTISREQEIDDDGYYEYIDPLIDIYGDINDIPDEEYRRVDVLRDQYIAERSIYPKIDAIMGEEIDGKYQGEDGWDENIMTNSRQGPWGGYVNPYGNTNHNELMATTVEVALQPNAPDFFHNLIDPSSRDYDSRYVELLDLFNQEGHIPDEQYNRIFENIPRAEEPIIAAR